MVLKEGEVSQQLQLPIKTNVESCKPVLQSCFRDYFPIRLTDVELRELSPSRQLVQEHSKYALVFESEGSYYKYSHCPRPTFATTVFRRPQTELAIFPSDTTEFFTKEFYMFDKQAKPLKPDHAKKEKKKSQEPTGASSCCN